MKNNRFSQFEALLLIVVIVGVVAGLALPIISRNRRGRSHSRSHCTGNLKQIGLALLGYSGDYGGFFPPTPIGNNFEALDEDHSNDLPNSRVYGCPSFTNRSSLASSSDYWYVGSGLRDDNENATQVRLAFDKSGNHPKNAWMNALFIDGHVEGAKPTIGGKGWNDNSLESVLNHPYGIPTKESQ